MKAKKVYEFRTSGEIVSMGPTYNNLKLGSVLIPKKIFALTDSTGRPTRTNSGNNFYPEYIYIIINIEYAYPNKIFKVINIDLDKYSNKEINRIISLIKMGSKDLRNILNSILPWYQKRLKINLSKKEFDNRFIISKL
jgi:hypothetical protein